MYSYIAMIMHYTICTQVIADVPTITIRITIYNVLRQATLLGRNRVSCVRCDAQ